MHINSVVHQGTNFSEGDISVSNVSCGVGALYNHPIRTEEEAKACIDRVLKQRKGNDRITKEAFIVFSDIDYSHPDMVSKRKPGCDCALCKCSASGGSRIAQYIKDKKIGYIVETPAEYNPNSGNWIKVWVWHPPHDFSSRDKTLPKAGWMRYFDKTGRFAGSFDKSQCLTGTELAERIKYYEVHGYTVKE